MNCILYFFGYNLNFYNFKIFFLLLYINQLQGIYLKYNICLGLVLSFLSNIIYIKFLLNIHVQIKKY